MLEFAASQVVVSGDSSSSRCSKRSRNLFRRITHAVLLSSVSILRERNSNRQNGGTKKQNLVKSHMNSSRNRILIRNCLSNGVSLTSRKLRAATASGQETEKKQENRLTPLVRSGCKRRKAESEMLQKHPEMQK